MGSGFEFELPTNSLTSPVRYFLYPHSCSVYCSQFGHSRFADHGHFDFAGIGELLFESIGDVAADLGGRLIGRVFGTGNHAQLAAGLNRERLLDAGETFGDRFQFFHPLDVAFQRFAASTGREALQASAAATSTV